jgi:hypothetical protein
MIEVARGVFSGFPSSCVRVDDRLFFEGGVALRLPPQSAQFMWFVWFVKREAVAFLRFNSSPLKPFNP